MLKFVNTVEKNSSELAPVVLHQETQYLEPVLLSPDVQLDPVLVLVLAASLDGFLLHCWVHRQLPGIEPWQCLQSVIEVRWIAAEAQLPPGHPAAGHHIAIYGGRWEHRGEVQRDNLQAIAAGDRPNRFAMYVMRGCELDMAAGRRDRAKEVKHAVIARTSPRSERYPGWRRYGWDDGAEFGPSARRHELLEEGHDTLLHQRVEDCESSPVKAD